MTHKPVEPGKIAKLWPYLVKLHQENPGAFADEGLLKATVSRAWKSLNDPEHCPNCGESMAVYSVRLDYHNAALVKRMGDAVLERLAKGMDFTLANRVHVVSSNFSDSVRHRTSQCRTLGLIAKVKNAEGKHDREKGWLLTARGFAALRGEAVPAEVTVFRNKIEERPDVKMTLREAFAGYNGESREHSGYDISDYVHIAGTHEGDLL